jgi:uncharacterized RDD family membrane protein YckC
MSERSGPDESSGLTPGDPLGGPPEPPPPPPELPDEARGPFGPSSSLDDPAPPPPPVAQPEPVAPPEPPEPQYAGPGGLPRDPTPPGVPPRPAPPASTDEAPSAGGLWGSGDPLAGSSGYTSPPPPGAGGLAPPPSTSPLAGRYVLASWGSRVGATLIDGLIVGVGAIVLFFILTAVFSAGFAAGDNEGFAAIVVGLLLWAVSVAIIALLYAPTLMARTNGQTWGRQIMKIRVIRTSGEPVTFGFAVVREVLVKALLVGAISSFTAGIGWLIDVLWPLWDEENRALHDFVVQTRTVKTD